MSSKPTQNQRRARAYIVKARKAANKGRKARAKRLLSIAFTS